MNLPKAIRAAVVHAAPIFIAATIFQPAQAQYGLMGPDGSIRQYGLLIDGPNPGRVLQDRLTLPINRRSIDSGSGSIYRGNLLESAPSPMRRIQLCMQIGIC